MRPPALAVSIALAASVAFAASGTGPQAPPAPAGAPPAPPEFRSGTAVVVLDVVARDKKGRAVRDLTAGELQVSENGQRCEVQSFRYVESEATLEPAAAGAVAAPATPVEPAAVGERGRRAPLNLVTLVFDRLGLEDNRLAEKAARDFVERGLDARTQVAVLKIGTRLGVAQDFTGDKALLLAAIAEATSGRDMKDRPLTDQARRASRSLATASGFPVGPEAGEGGDASTPTGERVTNAGTRTPGSSVANDQALGMADVERKQREVIANALQMADRLQRQMEGQWSLYPLLALVKAQAPLAGRKTLIFFSPGMQVPSNLDDVFKTIVSEANRANVSIYAVDSRGLQARADIANSGAALRDAAVTSMQQQMKGASDPTTVAEMQIMDTVEDSLRLNVQQTLSDLAEQTGGFLVANANDFGKAVDRVAADIHGYYEIRYVPASAAFDGSFRRIGLRVERKDVVLRSRNGYFALPPSEQIVLPFEMPLFMALSAATPAHDFDHQAAALHFAAGPEGVETSIVVEVPLAPLEFPIDGKKKTFAQKLTTLAVLKDAEGRVVERFSDEYPLSGPADQLAAVRQSNAVLRRLVPLEPGRYTLESASQVASNGRTSVQRSTFDVPAAGAGPGLSSLCLLRRADPLPADAPTSADPFRYEQTRLVPHLGGPVSKAQTPNLSFFARVYPASGGEPATLTLDFVKDGKIVGRAQPPLPAPDVQGRIAYVGGVPSAGFAPGRYEIRLTAAQGTARTTASTALELVP